MGPRHSHLVTHFSWPRGCLQGCLKSSASFPAPFPSQAWRWHHPLGTRHLRASLLWTPGLDLGMVGLGQLSLPLRLPPLDPGSAPLPHPPFSTQPTPWPDVSRVMGRWPPRSVSSRLLGDRSTLRQGAASPGPKREGGAPRKEQGNGRVGHCPHLRPPSPWASVQWAPKNFRIPLGPGGRPELPLAHALCCAHPATDICPAALPASCSAIPLITASWDPNGFHHGPPPPRGAGAGRGPGHPHHSPGPKATIHVSPVAVCVPRLCSASPLGRPLLLVRLSTLQPLHLSPTNLSWPLSPHFFLPSAPHRNVPGPATGPSAAPSASLCTCLSVSLCPVTSNSFGGADHLFPGCFAAVLRLWRGQNDFDFLIPSAVSLRSLLLSPLFLTCVYLSSYFSPLLLPVPARVSTCPRVCPRVCPPVRVRVCVCVCACALLWPRLWLGRPRVPGRGGVSPCCPGKARFSQQACRLSESWGVRP